jgi:hypothetical protein
MRMARGELGDAVALGLGPGVMEQRERNELVVDDDVGLTEQFDGSQRQQSGMSGPRPDQGDQWRGYFVHAEHFIRWPGLRRQGSGGKDQKAEEENEKEYENEKDDR